MSLDMYNLDVWINEIHQGLLLAAVDIGDIITMPHWASTGIAARICSTGKALDELSVGQLISIIKQQERDHAGVESLVKDKLTGKGAA